MIHFGYLDGIYDIHHYSGNSLLNALFFTGTFQFSLSLCNLFAKGFVQPFRCFVPRAARPLIEYGILPVLPARTTESFPSKHVIAIT